MLFVVDKRTGRLGPMYSYTGSRHTNGATANLGVGGFASTATTVPVAAVRENVLVARSGLIHDFFCGVSPRVLRLLFMFSSKWVVS